jgi:integrase
VIDKNKPISTQAIRRIFESEAEDDWGKKRGKLVPAMREELRAGRATTEEYPNFVLSPHVMRRTFACLALIQHDRDPSTGLGLIQLQEAMGHASLNETRKYLSDVEGYLNRQRRRFDVDEALEDAIRAEGELS